MRKLFIYFLLFQSVTCFSQSTKLEFLSPQVNNASNAFVTSATTTTLTWTWSDGSLSSRIMIMKSGSAVSSNPVNGTSYTASNTFGSGTQIGSGNYVVNIGSGPVTITGLTQGTLYYVSIFEFNGSGGTEAYFTTNPATAVAASVPTMYATVLSYAVTNSYTLPNQSEQNIASIYLSQFVSSGVAAKKLVLWIPATNGDRNFAKINYMNPGTFNLTEVGTPTFQPDMGFSSGDGVSYLSTNFKLVTNGASGSPAFTATSNHYAIFVSEGANPYFNGVSTGNNTGIEFGVGDVSLNAGTYYGAGIVSNFQTAFKLNSNTAVNKTYDQNTWGYALLERRAASSNIIFRQKNYSIDNTANTGVTPNDNFVFMCCVNAGGTPTDFSSRPVGMLSMGTELGATLATKDADLFNYYIQAIQGIGNVTNYGFFSVYESPYQIIATRDNYQFGTDGYNLRWSSDYGATWTVYPWGEQWTNIGQATTGNNYQFTITGAHIFATGTLLFTISNKIYRSANGLGSAPTQIIAQHANGTTYTIHTPSVASEPGSYFGWYDIEGAPSTLVSGAEILVWGNYANVALGAAPVNVWYSIDDGATVKAAYEFGQNTNYRDDGTDDGGSTGTLLGDAGNTTVCRHIHSITRNPGTDDWYMATGDAAPSPAEINWMKLTYNEGADTWSTSLIHNSSTTDEWKSVNLNFVSGNIYFGTDGGGTPGVYLTTIANIGNIGLATRKLSTPDIIIGFRINPSTGFMVVLPLDVYATFAQNFGTTSFNYTIGGASIIAARPASLSVKDGRGYYKFNVGGIGVFHFVKTVFIKEN